jgi:hypothetical protein
VYLKKIQVPVVSQIFIVEPEIYVVVPLLREALNLQVPLGAQFKAK